MTHIFEPRTSCGQRSYVFVEMNSGGQLSYCGHHWAVHEEKLRPIIKHLIDLRDEILA